EDRSQESGARINAHDNSRGYARTPGALLATAALMLCVPMASRPQTGGNTTPPQGPPPMTDPLVAIDHALPTLINAINAIPDYINSLFPPNGNNSNNSNDQTASFQPIIGDFYVLPDGRVVHIKGKPQPPPAGGTELQPGRKTGPDVSTSTDQAGKPHGN